MARTDTAPAEAGEPTTAAPVALRRLLVGCDDSDGSARAAAFALALAGATGAHATLLHAGPDPAMTPGHAEAAAAAAKQVRAAERAWATRLDELRAQAPAGAAVDARLERGSPAPALMEAARTANADLVLLGSGGVGHVRGALLGSVSSQLLHHAPCSVMLFPEGQDPAAPAAEAERVVVGVDGSAGSRHALRVAQGLAAALGAQVVPVHATDPHVPAREALADACAHHEPALLVVGTRGLGGFKGLLVGSTSQWLANHAPCPVLVAREPAGEPADTPDGAKA